MKTATLVETVDRSKGDPYLRQGLAAVYKLSEPLTCRYVKDGEPFDHVFVSTSTVLGQPETYAFAANPDGSVISWSELDGSQKGNVSHATVLEGMGYELRTEAAQPKEPKDG